jgi:peptidoglycan biosynthesis protein MviN/MurJ (putative lipid II flippase)
VPAICFLFLALDEGKYRAFRPLAALVVAGSLAALLVSLIPVAANPEKTFFAAGDTRRLGAAAIASFLVLSIDLFSLIVLAPRGKKDRIPESGTDGADQAPASPSKEQ